MNKMTPSELETMYDLLEKFERQLQEDFDKYCETHEYSSMDSRRYGYEYQLSGVRRVLENRP